MTKSNAQPRNSAQALDALVAGNKRFVTSSLEHPHWTPERRTQINDGQSPFAVILGCSDSRVPPEVVFDQGLGDLFVIRTAGNIVDDVALGSIEYAAAHLNTPLIMVLGHTNCGAVAAAIEGGAVEGHISSIVDALRPAVEEARAMEGDLLDNAARINAGLIAEKLRTAVPVLSMLVAAGRLEVAAAYYHLETGMVEILT